MGAGPLNTLSTWVLLQNELQEIFSGGAHRFATALSPISIKSRCCVEALFVLTGPKFWAWEFHAGFG